MPSSGGSIVTGGASFSNATSPAGRIASIWWPDGEDLRRCLGHGQHCLLRSRYASFWEIPEEE